MSTALAPDVDREAWLAARRKGIGASEIAAVLGISPWESPFSLYWRKVNGWNYEPSAAMDWGNRLEDAIAQAYADRHVDDWLVERAGLMEGPEPWILATPDRLLTTPVPDEQRCYRVPPGVPLMSTLAVLELKTAHSAHDGWGETGTSEIPVTYRAQVQWQMLVVGVQWAHVAVLIGGSDYREYEVLRDERDIAVMVEAGRRFMARIENGDPPPLDDHHATLATVKRLHPDLDDDATAEVDEQMGANYLRACRAYKVAEKAKARYETLLRDQMGRAKRAVTPSGRKVATRTVSEIAASTVVKAAHRRDYLTPAKPPKEKP